MTEKPIPESDRVPDVFELSRRVNEPFEKREARMSSCSPPNPELEIFYRDEKVPTQEITTTDNKPFQNESCGWSSALVEPEPMPIKNELPFMWTRAMERFVKLAQARDEFGAKKYGTRLQPFNGRNPKIDALQELLDAFVYFEQILFEETYKQVIIDAAVALSSRRVAHDETLLKNLDEAVKQFLAVQNK